MAATMNLDGRAAWLPWRISGTALEPNLLLLAKLMFLVTLRGGIFSKLGDPYLPFADFLDGFREHPGWFGLTLRSAYVLGGLLLAFNFRVRTACLLLGASVILGQFANTPSFRNHVYICGCVLFLTGCHRRGEEPWLLRWQFVLLYFGAALNKTLQADWWSGQFLETWLTREFPVPTYHLLAGWFPARSMAAVMSWAVIASEWLIATCFAVRSLLRLGIWLIVLLHGGILVFVMGDRFGHFWDDILVTLLAFLTLPTGPVDLRIADRARNWLEPWVRRLDWEGAYCCQRTNPNDVAWLELEGQGIRERNEAALRRVLLGSSGTFFLLFGVDWLLDALLPEEVFRPLTIVATLIALAIFIPIPWTDWYQRWMRPIRPVTSQAG